MSIKLVFLLSGSALNRGMNTGLENLAWALADRGQDVSVISGGKRPEKPYFELESKKVEYIFTGSIDPTPEDFYSLLVANFSSNSRKIVIGWIRNISFSAKKLRELNFRFISNIGQIPPRSIWLSELKRAIKYRNEYIRWVKRAWIITNAHKYIDYNIAISKFALEKNARAYNLKESKCEIVHRGINLANFSYETSPSYIYGQDQFKIAFIGNVIAQKGIIDLLESLRYIDQKIQVSICGTYSDNMRKKILSYCSDKKDIKLKGSVLPEEIVSTLHECHAFVFPSYKEGLGKALIEAMAAGCPVITSDIPTFKEVIKHNETGIIVPLGKPRIMAAEIHDLMKKNSFRIKISENARKSVVLRFSIDTEREAWESLIMRFAD